MMSFGRTLHLSDLRYLMFWRKLGVCKRSKHSDHSQTMPECPCPVDDDPCHDPCPPCPPCPCPKPSPYEPHADPRKHEFFRRLSLFVVLPVISLISLITYVRQQEKAKKPRQPYLDLPYMCRRTKPFPWGDGNHSLFHNPVKNPVRPYGYEVEDPNALVKKGGN
ncbi:cytochrome c oxidase subunit 6A1, mitochondrial-like [Linepithema humile]|uniref:cytochrome c oxidase subunit 6A1, mitochondrial-like n=1 Tax=Linepithema humile TaxID=83485 RepID=UPI00351ECFF0